MTAQRQEGDLGSGCAGLFVEALVIGVVVAAAISISALIDPFAWMPPVGELWEDCGDDPETNVGDCGLTTRFPGFWGHAAANFAYALTAAGLLLALAGTVVELRQKRIERFDGEPAAERYAEARREVAVLVVLCALLAALLIVVAVA